MGKIIASCGHEVTKKEEFLIEYHEYQDINCKIYKSICLGCLDFYQKELKAKIIQYYSHKSLDFPI